MPSSQTSDLQNSIYESGDTVEWHGSKTLVLRRSQVADLHGSTVVVNRGFVVLRSPAVVGGGVVVGTQGVSGTCHWPAESEHFSTWPLGARQSLVWELSQVPHCPSVLPLKREYERSMLKEAPL